MDFPDRPLKKLAAQLGHPRGLPGRAVGRILNLTNRTAITAAVDALEMPPRAEVADLGFGGGIGLELLLSRLDTEGRVHGIDQSATMLATAARRFRPEIANGRLALYHAAMERMPLETASLDGAITLNTIYFIADLPGALQECARVIKTGGQLVVGVSDPDTMADERVVALGFRVRPLAEITSALRDAGLELKEERRVRGRGSACHLLIARK